MGKKIENLRWKPMWVSHLGCIKGCLNYLNLNISDAWLFGGTGHAFIINMHEVVCPSGPTAWHTEMLPILGKNIGYTIDGVLGLKSHDDFAEKKRLAWEKTKQAINEGFPCYGWELDIPEFYVVHGYDDIGYYYSGPLCDNGKGPKPWNELGNSQIGLVEMYSIRLGQAADDIKTIKESLQFALEHSESPAKWIYPNYKSGLAGFDTWIQALENGKAIGFGMAYNAAVWSECRGFAVGFLREAKKRVGKLDSLFDGAVGYYETVAQNLKKVSEMFPFPPPGWKITTSETDEIKDKKRCQAAINHISEARKAEEKGLDSLRRIVAEL